MKYSKHGVSKCSGHFNIVRYFTLLRRKMHISSSIVVKLTTQNVF